MSPDDPTFALFLDVAAALNRRFGVAPVLFGSLGLGRVVPLREPAGDIDVLVPDALLADRWPELVATLADLGWELADPREHAFRRGPAEIAFAGEADLVPFAGVDPAGLRLAELSGARFRELTPHDYLRVYRASQHDGYRRDTRGKRDADKIAQIQRWLDAQS